MLEWLEISFLLTEYTTTILLTIHAQMFGFFNACSPSLAKILVIKRDSKRLGNRISDGSD
jgi:hypothetical protein